jgi:hypothetical protein
VEPQTEGDHTLVAKRYPHSPRTPMSDRQAITLLKLSIQRALLGEVTNRLHSLTCGLKDRHIEIAAYFNGVVTPGDIERIQIVGAEVIADFPEGYTIEEHCSSLRDCEEQMLDFWAFRKAAC